jgi:hypothetical protein
VADPFQHSLNQVSPLNVLGMSIQADTSAAWREPNVFRVITSITQSITLKDGACCRFSPATWQRPRRAVRG